MIRICNEIGSKFFCKDFVYENLKYYNDKNNKIELCDGLFEYCGTYVALQIKERDKSKSTIIIIYYFFAKAFNPSNIILLKSFEICSGGIFLSDINQS